MRRLSILLCAAILSGCATATPPTEVTRFHRLAPPTPTTMVIGGRFRIVNAAAEAGTSPSMEWMTYAAAVGQELQRIGLTPAAADTAPGTESYRVLLTIDRASLSRRSGGGSGVGVGVGGSTGSYGSGVGVGVGLDLTRLLSGGEADTALRLAVRMNDRQGASIWEGRAETAVRSRSPAGQPGLAAARLASALFAGFPGRSGETITVP